MTIQFNIEQFSRVLKKGHTLEDLLIILMLEQKDMTIKEIQNNLNLCDRTIYRRFKVLKDKDYIKTYRKAYINHYKLREEVDKIWD
jgi:transcriptional antiterminator